MKASPTLYTITANLTSLGFSLNSQVEAVKVNFYADGDVVLATKNDVIVVGTLRRVGSRLRVDVPAYNDHPAQTHYIERADLLGIAQPV